MSFRRWTRDFFVCVGVFLELVFVQQMRQSIRSPNTRRKRCRLSKRRILGGLLGKPRRSSSRLVRYAFKYINYENDVFSISRYSIRDEVKVTLSGGQGIMILNAHVFAHSDSVRTHKSSRGGLYRKLAGEEFRIPYRYVPSDPSEELTGTLHLYEEHNAFTGAFDERNTDYTNLPNMLKRTNLKSCPLKNEQRLFIQKDDDIVACTANIELRANVSFIRSWRGKQRTFPTLQLRRGLEKGFVLLSQPETGEAIHIKHGESYIVDPDLFYMAILDKSATFLSVKGIVGAEVGYLKLTGPAQLYLRKPMIPEAIQNVTTIYKSLTKTQNRTLYEKLKLFLESVEKANDTAETTNDSVNKTAHMLGQVFRPF